MDTRFAYTIQGTVLRKPERFGGMQSAMVQAERSLKGDFDPRRLILWFYFQCGAGGPKLHDGQKLTMYLSIIEGGGDGKTYGLVEYWRPAEPERIGE
jgi:hypothetical protein|tara:strand:+ start:1110 stop:1400 length:291 start_codon:yes stop_codon:yes gene_type:complete